MGNSSSTAYKVADLVSNKEDYIEKTPKEKQLDSESFYIPPECPMHMKNEPMQSISGCPNNVEPPHQAGTNYGEEFAGKFVSNPLNKEGSPNQKPSPDQPFSLSTERQVSSIPMGNDQEKNWVYPSPQMFWNAMLRKGWRWKTEEVSQDDMNDIIKIHNVNNEDAWKKILEWEHLHRHECDRPRLKRFGGKAADYSPKARFRQLMGHELPYDRHDWIVDRCGKEVRYIIDYYNSEDEDLKKYNYACLDIRPALDTWENLYDRLVISWFQLTRSNDDS